MKLFHHALFGRLRRRHHAVPRHQRPPLRCRLEIEALDQRITPAVTVVPSSSTLSIIGDNSPDVVSVRILGVDSSTLVLAVFNNSTGTGAPIATPVLTSPVPQIPILSLATIQFSGNGGD